jgi:hypothetical protein
VALFDYQRELFHACDELAKVGPTLGAAIDRFKRRVAKEAARTRIRHAPIGRPPSRLPQTHAHRPVRHHVTPVAPLRGRTAATVLDRRRAADARRRGGQESLAASVEGGAARAVDAIRTRLQALRDALLRRRRQLGTRR